ncbi:uncharacterized protein K02A2.6-like [Achroia grisella]|uniref:uncharacterized protein K02A2.6-like n=1 Tax=Achroia grisella TaxID=688607 RepID=UPI0027D2E720|nr:uncharacterized protein K02A2.6-like [Achroia grisella]
MIGSCDICLQMRPSPPRATISPWPYPPHLFHRVHLDFLEPLHGRTFLVIVDAYSKWVEVYEMNICASIAVIEKLCEFMSSKQLGDCTESSLPDVRNEEDMESQFTGPTFRPSSLSPIDSSDLISGEGGDK